MSTWVGREEQAILTFDQRYSVPAYTGHNGWIELDVQDELVTKEATHLIGLSYRHFALKRMLKALDGLV